MSIAASPFPFALCADDYAMTPAVTRGIVEALEAGVLSATSVMTTSPWWPEAAPTLRPFKADVDIGLHLNLTSGAPLGPMPGLAPGGEFPPIATYIRSARTLPLPEVDAEIGRQIEAFLRVFGSPPDHVDGHQHVQVVPAIRDLLLGHLDRLGLRGRVWIRDSGDDPRRILSRGTNLTKALGLAWLARGTARVAQRRGYGSNKGFAGFSPFRVDDDYGAAFSRFLVSPGRRHLVMCHPGHVDDALRRLDPVTETREQELAFLLSPAFPEVLARRRARLARLSRLPAPAAG